MIPETPFSVSRHEADAERLKCLLDWLAKLEIEVPPSLPYSELREHLLSQGILKSHKLPRTESDPYVLGEDFYGESFEQALETLP